MTWPMLTCARSRWRVVKSWAGSNQTAWVRQRAYRGLRLRTCKYWLFLLNKSAEFSRAPQRQSEQITMNSRSSLDSPFSVPGLGALATESRNPRTAALDQLSVGDLIK